MIRVDCESPLNWSVVTPFRLRSPREIPSQKSGLGSVRFFTLESLPRGAESFAG
jgi:hypothetical protein